MRHFFSNILAATAAVFVAALARVRNSLRSGERSYESRRSHKPEARARDGGRSALARASGWCAAVSLAICTWAVAVPPLSLDGYRDEKLMEGAHESAGLKELNGGCYVCHGNYRTESLVTSHAKQEVGCIECHGKSVAHQIDEFHRTPPEKMYGPHNVDNMCGECHEEHDAPARKVIQRWQQRCPSKTNPKEITCTDCHFKHRLPKRTVVWDKKTGKLVIHDKAQDAKNGKDGN